MAKLDVTDQLITSMIQQVAPQVMAETGWDLQLPTLKSRVLPKDQGYEELVQGRLRGMGVTVSENHNIVERILEYLIENNVLGAYQPYSQELLVVREHVDDSNLPGLSLVLGHELVHRGQHVHHPQLFEQIDQTVKALMEAINQSNVNFEWVWRKMEEIRPRMTLIESHATYFTRILKQKFYPDAKVETHFNLPVLLFKFLGAGKVSQYIDGLPQVSQAASQGKLDDLFRSISS
jgi:hypothetical protein